MRRLTTFVNGIAAAALQQELELAGIEAQITQESLGHPHNRLIFALWVEETADQAAIEEACAAVQARYADILERPATRVSSIEDMLKCKCGYDLRGQVEDGKCPECGHPYQIIKYKSCGKCGEEIPADFDVCWQCGNGSEAEEDAT